MKNNKPKLLFDGGTLVSLSYNGKELLKAPSPVFRVCLREYNGASYVISSDTAETITEDNKTFVFSGFSPDIKVTVRVEEDCGRIRVYADIKNNTGCAVEWITLLPVSLKPLCGDGGEDGTRLLLPYNEGLLLDSVKRIPDIPPEYPSSGGSLMFPNMMFAQTASYLYSDGVSERYMNVYTPDETRAPKEITVKDKELIFKQFCGARFGEDVSLPCPLVLSFGEGGWERSCDGYREWFETHLPPSAKKAAENKALPEWYDDDLLVLTYPVRGVHDMDTPEPNALFPYENALPLIDEIKNGTGMRPLVLLMHWEGTAPWAPPYVWPPYGGEGQFNTFKDKLHERGCLLGVYCSGFGYTKQSNIIKEYDNTDKIDREDLYKYFCTSPDGSVTLSRICTAQRSGYDVCPACGGGKNILTEAYSPLFESGVDYAQILDQNHGGSQYFCYGKHHGHAPVPGKWMTEKMQTLLSEWNGLSNKMLLGCESAAAEPYIGDLLFSDDRYELCFDIGRPVPMYAYMYHEYLHNFMGNQVCCYFPPSTDALLYRIAYSFAAGDAPTLVLTGEGGISPAWGTRDFSALPDKEEVLSFLNKLRISRNSGLAPYLNHGKMIPTGTVLCDDAPFGNSLPSVIITSFEYNNKRTDIIINPFYSPKTYNLRGKASVINGRSIEYFEY